MRVARAGLIASIVATAVLTAGPATAGGASNSWLEFDQPYLVVGHTVTGATPFFDVASGTTGGRIADGPYTAYLMPADRWIRPPHIPAEAIPLGIVRANDIGEPGTLARARLTFTVPNVPPGHYSIEFCNDPCTESSVGNLYGSEVHIVATPLDARLAALEDRSERKLARAEWKLARRIRQLGRAQERLADMSGSQTLLAGRVSDLQREVEELREAAEEPRTDVPWWTVVAASLMVAGALLVRRRPRRSGPTPAGGHGATVVFPVVSDVVTPELPEREPVSSRT